MIDDAKAWTKKKWVKFVPEGDGQSQALRLHKNNSSSHKNELHLGNKIRNFYESLIDESSDIVASQVLASSKRANCTSSASTSSTISESVGCRHSLALKTYRLERSPLTPGGANGSGVKNMKLHQFLKYAEDGNLDGVRAGYKQGIKIDERDQFGWNALMCASFAGRIRVVNYLLLKGANPSLSDKASLTAADLAFKNGHNKVYSLLTEKRSFLRHLSTNCEKKLLNRQYCSNCDCYYFDDTHRTSTAHLVATKKPIVHPGYVLPEWNKGYKIMRSCGWDEFKGLGRDSTGYRYPVKTRLKRDRFGIGCETGVPKVTHFKAHDIRSVEDKKIPRNDREGLNVVKKTLRDQKMMERKFRNEFKD